METKQLTGSQAVLEACIAEGVDTIFGYPGGAIMPIYDALYDYMDKLKHVLVRHEQGGIHAGQGYARTSGKVGVVFATSGPGATNLVTGLADAMIDSTPLVCITGQVFAHLLGTDAFQETDIYGITLPIVKHSYVVRDAKDMARIVAEAFHIASTGRPGPVLIDVPKDVALEEFDYVPVAPGSIKLPGYRPTVKGNPRQINAAIQLIRESHHPLLYIGEGAIAANAHNVFARVRIHSTI